ncbi:MAG: type I-C CRISPR-associated protein Cas5 [Verrucomicrobia bacterium]|nr:type I-C CRISPR-associated protein Cas5 [Verrucomicrobiota bacterium]MDE3099918.1 type I-C CRISPR-associated protein Cas5 [Verrucomicrobiota bacterium]
MNNTPVMRSNAICLRVKGPFACFTRPEFHVERVSYPVITPSAARGILEAILMKPIEKPEAGKRHNKVGFRWVITRLGIIKKGTMFSILRNELGYGAHQKPENATGYDINGDRIRAQRHSLILKDVEYLIEAVIEVPPEARLRGGRQVRPSAEWLGRNKYHQMFLRRARAGQCFYQPFFGCREFSVAEWEVVERPPEKIPDQPPEEKFGMIFRDFDFKPMWDRWQPRDVQQNDCHPFVPRPANGWDQPGQRPDPKHFSAEAVNGWITVPERSEP